MDWVRFQVLVAVLLSGFFLALPQPSPGINLQFRAGIFFHSFLTSVWVGTVAILFGVGLYALLLFVGWSLGNRSRLWLRRLALLVESTSLVAISSIALLGLLAFQRFEDLSLFVVPFAALSLSLKPAFFFLLHFEQALSETKNALCLQGARAKGLSEFKVFFRHQLALIRAELLALVPPQVASLLTGSVIVESIFGYRGLGVFFLASLRDSHFLEFMASALVFSGVLRGTRYLIASEREEIFR